MTLLKSLGRRATILVVSLTLVLTALVAIAPNAEAAPMTNSPADCVLKANDPHRSTWNGGVVKGVAQVDCEEVVDALYVKAQLWRSRWWGWEKVGFPGSNTNYYQSQVKGTAWWSDSNCDGYHDWRTAANGWSLEWGITYTATVTGVPVYLNC